jgi:glycosyltransferase involved in cell wall biosynthesis
MKSVCIVVQSVYDFDPRVKRKADALVAAGYAVDVLALRPDDGRTNYVLNGVNVYTIDLGKKRGSLARYLYEYAMFFLWAFVKVPMLMRRRRYAVVDVNTLPDFLIFAPIVARWMGAKLVLDMHEITPEFYMSKYEIGDRSLLVRVLKFLEKVSMDFADQVITINQPIEDLFVGRGLDRAKSTIVMNAVDEARFMLPEDDARAGRSGRFVMMYHGTLTRIYGLDLAVEAFGRAAEEMPGAELWILGSGPEQPVLAEAAQRCGVADRVKLIGQVASKDIPSWLIQCDLGLLPIRRDVFLDFAFPNKLPEFIVAGKPVLISRLKSIRHYFSDDALAFFEPNDAGDLAREMVRVYQDPERRRRLVGRAREEYAPIRWDVMKRTYVDLIDRLSYAGERTPQRRAAETTIAAR